MSKLNKNKLKLNKNLLPVIKIQNFVVSVDLHASIDLYALSDKIREVDYEPEQFPGAIFRIAMPKSVLIIFKNGKMICTGAKTIKDIKEVLAYVSKILAKYVIKEPI